MTLRYLVRPSLALVLLGALACNDLPTSAPLWDTTWILPIKADTIRVAQFLPASVDTAGGVFTTTVKRDSVRQSLGQMCPGCGAAQGTTASIPAFTDSLTHADSFPSQVVSITPGGFSLSFRIDNGLGFDPLRPGVGKIGKIVTVITDSAGTVVATDSVDGTADSLLNGTSLTRSISLGSTPIVKFLSIKATVSVPATDPVLVDTANFLKVTTLTDTVTLAGVTVQLTNQSIQSDSVSVDWSNIGSDIQSKMQGAVLQLIIHNPFTASGGGTVSFKQGANDVIAPKGITFAPGVTLDTVGVSQSDIQALAAAGKSTVTVNASVSGSGPGQSLTITPAQVAIVNAHLLVTIRVGGN